MSSLISFMSISQKGNLDILECDTFQTRTCGKTDRPTDRNGPTEMFRRAQQNGRHTVSVTRLGKILPFGLF